MCSAKCYLLLVIDTTDGKVKRALTASSRHVAVDGGLASTRQVCIHLTRGTDFDEANRRMRAIVRSDEYCWLRPFFNSFDNL